MGVETYTTNRMHRFAELFAAVNGPVSREALLRIKFDKAYSRASPAGQWMTAVLAVDTAGKPDLTAATGAAEALGLDGGRGGPGRQPGRRGDGQRRP